MELENKIVHYIDLIKELKEQNSTEVTDLIKKCDSLEEYQKQAMKQIEELNKESDNLAQENKRLKENLIEISEMERQLHEKDDVVNTVTKKLVEIISEKDILQRERDIKSNALCELKEILRKEIMEKDDTIKVLQKENQDLIKALNQKETCKYFL